MHIEEEEKFEKPTLKKVTKITSKDQAEEHEVISLRKMIKPPVDEEPGQLGIILKTVSKTETYEKKTMVYSEAVSEVTVTSHCESEKSTIPYEVTKRTETMSSGLEKKTDEQVQLKKPADDFPKIAAEKSTEVVDGTQKADEKAEEKYGVKKTPKKTLKEDISDTSSLVKKKITKLPLKEQEQETVKLKPFDKPAKPETHEVVKTIKGEDKEHDNFQRSERTLKDKPAREPVGQSPAKQKEIEMRERDRESVVAKDEKVEEKAGIKKSKTPKDEESQVPGLVRKKVSKLPFDEKEQEIVKLKPLPKSAKEVEKPVQDSAVDGREIERIGFPKSERPIKDETCKEPFSEPSKLPEYDITEKLPVAEREKGDEKAGVKKTKTPKDEETQAPGLVRKKIAKLPSSEKEQEIVKLKPFEKPAKENAEKERKDSIKDFKEREPVTFNKSERPGKSDILTEPVAEKIPSQAPKDSVPEKPSVSDKVFEEQKVKEKAVVKKAKTPKDEEPKGPGLAPKKISKLPSSEKEPEMVKLKPIDKPGKPETSELQPEKKAAEKEREHSAFQRGDRPPKDEIVKEPETQPMRVEKHATPDKEPEITGKKDLPREAEQKPSPKKLSPVKKTEMSPKAEEKPALQKKVGQLPKDLKGKEEITLKPVELTKSIELRKTPSPQVDKLKPKAVESVPVERKPSGDIKRLPKKISPKDSIESVTLKKVPKTTSPPEKPPVPEEAIKTGKAKLPAMKVLSAEAVQLRKISTQYEEEVEEIHTEVREEGEDSWGWELVPDEDWEGEMEEGAVETPGMGGKRGESLAAKFQH